jgi:hypothetical protein
VPYRCDLLLYYRHRDDNQITFLVENALVKSGDAPAKTDIYTQIAAAPKKVLFFVENCSEMVSHENFLLKLHVFMLVTFPESLDGVENKVFL